MKDWFKNFSSVRQVVLVSVSSFLLGIGTLYAADPVDLTVGYQNPIPLTPGHGKSPVQVPTVTQEGHQLYFESAHADYTLEIVQGGATVYSVFVSSATTLVNLPLWLTGNCELQLYEDGSNIYYYGYIAL